MTKKCSRTGKTDQRVTNCLNMFHEFSKVLGPSDRSRIVKKCQEVSRIGYRSRQEVSRHKFRHTSCSNSYSGTGASHYHRRSPISFLYAIYLLNADSAGPSASTQLEHLNGRTVGQNATKVRLQKSFSQLLNVEILCKFAKVNTLVYMYCALFSSEINYKYGNFHLIQLFIKNRIMNTWCKFMIMIFLIPICRKDFKDK